MSENPNDRDQNTPPALIVPPVRSADSATADDTSSDRSDPSTGAGATEPAFSDAETGAPATSAPVTSTVPASSDRSSTETPNESDRAAYGEHPREDTPAVHEIAAHETAVHETAVHETAAHETAAPAATTAAAPVVVPAASDSSDTRAHDATAPAPATTQAPDYAAYQQPQQPQRVFVPPLPVAPKKKGNRGVGSLIAVLSVIVFAALYALVSGVIIAVRAPADAFEVSLRFLTDPVFYVPAILFVVGFVIVVLLVNRSGWWAHVIGSLVVAAIVYFGTIGFQLLTDGGFGLTPSEANARFLAYGANPFVIAAALVARETALWIGAIISSRGRRMKTRNATARADFERATAEHRAEYERAYTPAS